MKSAPSGDRTRLAGGPATSPSGRQRRGYTTGRSGHRSRQLSDCAFPRDRGFARESAPGGSDDTNWDGFSIQREGSRGKH
ncbi:hypothetical protein JEQ12_001684 [Ovis aries]|uniref:Uncharacterized protein n=1 Tax=Ovis aries TaxID=9940 RepID=A0A836AQK6_SHEEP|nr:hypothetical protein JEQ12_001684 [Ovis aries]